MAKKNNYAVIGIGQFGSSVCETLAEAHQDVLAIDRNEEVVNEYANLVTRAVIADCQDEEAMRELDIGSFDNVYISVGNIQASIMATLIVKELGARNIICKAENENHARVLEKIGADYVVRPERDMARRMVFHQLHLNIANYLILNHELTLAEVEVKNQKFCDRPLKDLGLREYYQVNVIAIVSGDEVNKLPQADNLLHYGDHISVVGDVGAIQRLSADITHEVDNQK